MTFKGLHILSMVILTAVLPAGGAAQEILKASRVEARGGNP